MMSRVCAGLIGLFLWSGQAFAEELVFRVGHPALPVGCASPELLQEGALRNYLNHLSSRLRLPVEGCGADPASAATLVSKGDLSFALVSVPVDRASDGLRPILRVRSSGYPPRTEVVILGSVNDQPDLPANLFANRNAEDLFVAAYTPQELLTLLAVVEGRTIDDPRSVKSRDKKVVSLETPWQTGEPLTDPISAARQLKNGNGDELLIMTQGRYHEFCIRNEGACEGVQLLWRGFPPLGQAFAVSERMALEKIYRLIGIHVALDLQRPDLVPTIGGREAIEFEPTEATAFTF